MSAHNPPDAEVIPEEPMFLTDGIDIYLRCVNDEGQHMGDLRIARAELAVHASTLVNAANAGMQFYAATRSDRMEQQLQGMIREMLE